MNFSEAIRFSLDSLEANPLRTFLTTLGLVIGNASVILVVTISLASKDLILNQIRGIGSNLVYAQYEAGGQNTAKVESDFIKLADVEAIRRELGDQIVAATGVMPNNDFIVVNGKVREVGINGVDQNYPTVRSIVSLAGRLIDAGDVASHAQRSHRHPETGAAAILATSKPRFCNTCASTSSSSPSLARFARRPSTFGQSEVVDETILIPYTVIRYFVQFERVDPLWLQVRRASDVPRVTAEVQRILESRHREGARYMVQNLKAILDTANQIATVLTIVLILVSAIALIISGIGIMNIMLVTVTERTREIGVPDGGRRLAPATFWASSSPNPC